MALGWEMAWTERLVARSNALAKAPLSDGCTVDVPKMKSGGNEMAQKFASSSFIPHLALHSRRLGNAIGTNTLAKLSQREYSAVDCWRRSLEPLNIAETPQQKADPAAKSRRHAQARTGISQSLF